LQDDSIIYKIQSYDLRWSGFWDTVLSEGGRWCDCGLWWHDINKTMNCVCYIIELLT